MNTEATTSISIRDFLHVVFKRKIQILLFFGATVSIVAIGTLITKPTYEATSQILVKIGRENLYVPTVPTSNNSRPIIRFNREEQINTEIEILKSRFLAEKVMESLGPTGPDNNGEGLVSGLNTLKVEPIENSDIIQVSYQHEDPQVAATVVNTLVSLYLDRHLSVHKNARSHEFFREQARILKNKLNQAEKSLEAFKESHAVSSLDEERSLLLRQEGNLRTALNQTLSQEAETESRIDQLRQQLAATPKAVPLDSVISQEPGAIGTLQAKLVELELELSKYTEHNPMVQNIRDEIKTVKKKLADQEAKRYGTSRSGVNTTYQRLQENLLRNEAELKALKAKKESQSAHLAESQSRLKKLNRIEVELNELQNEVEVDRQNYRLYLTKFEESRISDAMDTQKIANVSVIEPAQPPSKPKGPKVLLNMVLAIFLGGFGGLGLALLLEGLDDSLEKTEDVEKYLHLPVLASIPKFSGILQTRALIPVKEHAPQLKGRTFRPRFAVAASLVLCACLIVAVGLFLGNLRLNLRLDNFNPFHNQVQERVSPQPNSSNESALSALPQALAEAGLWREPLPGKALVEKVKSQTGLISRQHYDDQKVAGVQAEGEKEELILNTEVGSLERNEVPNSAPGLSPESKDENTKTANLVIQVGAFREWATAVRLMGQLNEKGYDAYVEERTLKNWKLLYLVRLQGYTSVSAAETEMARLKKQGLHDAFIASQS
jgi:polysaccharide chain length determinant protein (PEP-CTERM system associated)